jgi:Leucine-rich repeat (LRR) protein
LKKLNWLRLDGNKLKHIPSELDNLKKLTYLDLSCNKLTTVSSKLYNIKLLYLSGNPSIIKIEK